MCWYDNMIFYGISITTPRDFYHLGIRATSWDSGFYIFGISQAFPWSLSLSLNVWKSFYSFQEKHLKGWKSCQIKIWPCFSLISLIEFSMHNANKPIWFKVHDRVSLAVNKGQIRMHLSKGWFWNKNPSFKKTFFI